MPKVFWLIAGTSRRVWAAMSNTETGSTAAPLGLVQGFQDGICQHAVLVVALMGRPLAAVM
jgi:hypothetical protein